MAWFVLAVAGLFEVVWAYGMKLSDGFTKLVPSLVTAAAMMVSFVLLAWSMRSLPLGTAYMIWTGIGALGAFVLGVTMLGEPANPVRLTAALLILAGLALMKLATPG